MRDEAGRPRRAGVEELLGAYRDHLQEIELSPLSWYSRLAGARSFLEEHPDLLAWIAQPLDDRLVDLHNHPKAGGLIAWAGLAGLVQVDLDLAVAIGPGYLSRSVRALHPSDLAALMAASKRLGLSHPWRAKILGRLLPLVVAVRGVPPSQILARDLDTIRDHLMGPGVSGRPGGGHVRLAQELFSLRRLLWEAGMLDRQPTLTRIDALTSRATSLEVVRAPEIRRAIAAYLKTRSSVLRPTTMANLTINLAAFGEFVSESFPDLTRLSGLERHHVEAYCDWAITRTWRVPWARQRSMAPSSSTQAIASLRAFLEDIASWGWAEAPPRRLVFATDLPRVPKGLPRALPLDVDTALMAAVANLDDPFARDGLMVLRGTGLRIGELLDLEIGHLVDYQDQGRWLQVPVGKMADQRAVPIDGTALAAIEDWLAHRQPCRALPHPRGKHLADFVFVEGGRRLGERRLRRGLTGAVVAAGLTGPDGRPLRVVVHQLRHTWATSLANSGMSLQALMALLGHRSPEMTLRYATLASPTLRRAYDEAMGKVRPRIPVAPAGRPALPDKVEWLAAEMLKTRLAHGYCARELVAEACPYANVCENCANFVTTPEFSPVLESQLADELALRDDATAKGWHSEVARHDRVIASLEAHLRRLKLT